MKSLVCDTGLVVRVAAAGQSLALSPSLSPSDGAGWQAAAADRNGVSSFYMPLQYHFIHHDAQYAFLLGRITFFLKFP